MLINVVFIVSHISCVRPKCDILHTLGQRCGEREQGLITTRLLSVFLTSIVDAC